MSRKMHAPHDAHVRTWGFELRRFFETDHHAHARARHNESIHAAHVRAKISWVLLAQDAASRAEAQANAWRDNAENSPSNTTDRAQHARDFTEAIRRTTFFKTFPNQQIATQIDDALNEYHDLYSAREQRTEQEKAAREKAQALIEKLRRTFEEIAKNSLASAAVLEAFCHLGKPAELDERIASLNRAIESLKGPHGKRGARAQPELGRLIQRLAQLVVSARTRAENIAGEKPRKAAKINDDTAQNYIDELLKAGDVQRADDTLQKRLTNSRGQHYLTIASQQAIELEQLATPIIQPES